MSERTRYRLEDSIATIALDDGNKNVLSPAMIAELGAALDRAEADRAVVVLTGREGILSAGFDLKTLGSTPSESAAMVRAGFELAARLLAFPAPVVVACPGHAIAMGAFLLLAVDYRLGAAGPFKIFRPEEAVLAGFFVRVVPAAELDAAARAAAEELRKLDKNVHTATKRRARAPAIAAVRAAIDSDSEVFLGRS